MTDEATPRRPILFRLLPRIRFDLLPDAAINLGGNGQTDVRNNSSSIKGEKVGRLPEIKFIAFIKQFRY